MNATGICLNDDAFGPAVQGCRGDFDFTQKFESLFLAIIPSSVFIALTLARVAVLVQQPRIVTGAVFQYVKLAFIMVYSAVLLAWFVLLAKGTPHAADDLSVAAAALLFVASLFIGVLSYVEHTQSQRPSMVLGGYVFLTLLFDIVQTRTLWLASHNAHQSTEARLITSSVALKAIILGLESVPKRRWIRWDSKEHSPEESSSVFSLGVFFWVNQLMGGGYRSVLAIKDLYPLDASMSANTLYAKYISKAHVERYRPGPKFPLLKDLAASLAGPFLLPVAPRVAQIGFTFCQPFFINAMLSFLTQPNDTRQKNVGYGLIGASVVIYTGIAVSQSFYNYYNQRAIYMARGALVAAIYKKTTEMKLTTADDSAAITLMSTDVERIIRGAESLHDLWASVAQVAIGCWLLYDRLGVPFVAPLLTIIVCAIILAYIMRKVGRQQAMWMEKIQNRVGLTANAIANMKLYKVSGITGPVANLIQNLRVKEIKVGNGYRLLLVFTALMAHGPSQLAPVFTFAVTAHRLDVTTIYTSVSYIFLVTNPLTQMFQGIPTVLTALKCVERIQKFLGAEPRSDYRTIATGSFEKPHIPDDRDAIAQMDGNASQDLAFTIKKGNFGWSADKTTLSNINLRIPARQLTLIVGPVASGKSTLCKVLLGEIPVYDGTVTAHLPVTSIGYCEQTPFLYNASLKANIIGHCQFDQKKYDEVINATLLGPDVALLPSGHDTEIGSNGIMLSGGQRQRVSVARALYSEAQLVIFDDILSGLDTDTESELFRRVFGPNGIIPRRNSTAVVCTHSVKNLPSANHIIALGEGGTVVEEGTFEDLMENQKYVHSLGVKIATASSVSSDTDDGDKKQEVVAPRSKSSAIDAALDDRSRQTGDWSIYAHYFSTTSKLCLVSMVLTGITYGFTTNFVNIWLDFWTADTFDRSNSFYIGIYALLSVSSLLCLLCNAGFSLTTMVTFSGTTLHRRAITTVVTAPLKFFSTTDAGVVTNLFSQDMTLIDSQLPSAFINTSLNSMELVAMLFVVASASPYLAISYPFMLAFLWILQKFYLRTSRQMRLLDLEAKSPLYTHFIDSIKGVATIRAFGWQQAEIEYNRRLLDDSQRPAYLLASVQKWLMSTLQLIVAAIAVCLVALATELRTTSGLTGASLVTLLNLGPALAWLIISYTELETSIGAVNRLRTFSNVVKPEDQPGEDIEPPEEWPQNGRIDIHEVSASYDSMPTESGEMKEMEPTSNLVIKDLTLTISPRQKVAICGRTGSGKSSLILLLLRLLDPLQCCAENIEIDGVSYNRIDRTTLRKRIIAIPQDAVFLPDGSSVQSNIDPLEQGTEEECLSVLELVMLRGFVDDRGGLKGGMSSDDLSAGQKQLFSLGRAILRKRVRHRHIHAEKRGGLLLLDEVSSSVDKITDRAMQEIIRTEFDAYTIVMVSHRLEMVMDYFDRVIVLDKGVLVESGSPRELVDTPGSRFGELWTLGNHDTSSQ